MASTLCGGTVTPAIGTRHSGGRGRRSEVQDHPQLCIELEVRLGYMRPSLPSKSKCGLSVFMHRRVQVETEGWAHFLEKSPFRPKACQQPFSVFEGAWDSGGGTARVFLQGHHFLDIFLRASRPVGSRGLPSPPTSREQGRVSSAHQSLDTGSLI